MRHYPPACFNRPDRKRGSDSQMRVKYDRRNRKVDLVIGKTYSVISLRHFVVVLVFSRAFLIAATWAVRWAAKTEWGNYRDRMDRRLTRGICYNGPMGVR